MRREAGGRGPGAGGRGAASRPSRRRKLWIALAGLVVLAAVAAGIAIAVVRSAWFYEKVRGRIVAEVEKATGGRVELAAFRFDWKTLRADVQGFTLHGTEPAGKPPLFRASSAAVGLKIVSLLKRDMDIQYLDVEEPRVYLIVRRTGAPTFPRRR